MLNLRRFKTVLMFNENVINYYVLFYYVDNIL